MSDKYPGGFVTTGAPAGFSVFFDGTGDYLSAPTDVAFQFGTGNFTIEAFVYNQGTSASYPCIFENRTADVSTTTGILLNQNPSGYLNMYYGGVNTTSATLLAVNAWTHVAIVRNGSVLTLYQNGVSVGTQTGISGNLTDGVARIGAMSNGSGFWIGYMSNVRVVKGTAVYTAAFTPPTQLFPITNTSLLTCQSPTIIDNSTNAFTVTANGDAKVSNFTPFAGYTGFNPALGAAAGGVWTLDEAAYYQNNRQWPIYDPYFKNTTLMLHGNGTNAAQNNTFLDSSTNNFTITRNGNTTQGSFSPFSQTGWSNYFNGSGSLSTGTSTSLAFGTGDFTIEFWVNLVSYNGTYTSLFSTRPPSDAGGNGLDIQILLTGGNYQLMIGNPVGAIISANNVTSLNTWTHIAGTRVNGVMYLFINGVQVATGASTYNFSVGNAYWGAGAGGTNNSVCYISNLRVIKGTGLYASSFTPSTQPLASVTNTVLLSAQSNRFVDNSANNFTLTVNGSGTTIQAFSPFVPAYITPTTYSNYFSSGNLTTPSSAAFNLSSGDWTIEGWFLLNTNSDDTRLFTVVNSSTDMYGAIVRSGTIRFGQIGVGEAAFGTIALGTWNHIAFSKTSTSTITCYINGISTGTTTAYTLPNANCTVYIAASPANFALSTTNGVISNFRIVKGTAVYTTNFTPPTAPLTNITNTSLLTCQSSTFIDNSTNNFAITSTGNVQPVTSPTPFPAKVDTTTLNSAYSTSLIGGSAYFDGSGDYLNFTDSSNALDLGGLVASFEAWVYPTSAASAQHFAYKHGGALSWSASNGIEYAIAFDVNKFYFVYNNGGSPAFINGATTRQPYQWHHVVVATDASNNIALFVNGVREGTATNAITKPTTRTTITIGVNVTGGEPIFGYVSGQRFISGSGAYSPTQTAFAPPLTPPTAVTNTQLLLNYTNGAIFDNTAKNVLETVGNAQISTTQSKWGGSSMYCPTTNGNYFVSPPNQQNFLFGTGQFTVEAWVYPTAFTNSAAGAFGYGLSGGYVDWNLEINTSGAVLYIDNDAGRFTSSSNLSLNTWTHLCVVRTSSAVTMYFNGVSVGSYSTINNISGSSTSARLYVGTGAQVPGSRQFIGYIDDLRITKGVARYITNFTPPTSQLQDQ